MDQRGRIFVTTALSQSELNKVFQSHEIAYGLELPHSLNYWLRAKTQVQPGLPYIKLALRNCI